MLEIVIVVTMIAATVIVILDTVIVTHWLNNISVRVKHEIKIKHHNNTFKGCKRPPAPFPPQ